MEGFSGWNVFCGCFGGFLLAELQGFAFVLKL